MVKQKLRVQVMKMKIIMMMMRMVVRMSTMMIMNLVRKKNLVQRLNNR